MKPRLRPEVVDRVGKVVGDLDGLGDQPVLGGNLVERRSHQRFDDEAEARRVALDDIGVEAVERADRVQLDRAALGGVGVYVAPMGKVGRISECPHQRKAVALDDLIRRRRAAQDEHRPGQGAGRADYNPPQALHGVPLRAAPARSAIVCTQADAFKRSPSPDPSWCRRRSIPRLSRESADRRRR